LTEQMPDQSANAAPQISSNTVVASSEAPTQAAAANVTPIVFAVVAPTVAQVPLPKVPVVLPKVSMEALNREPLEAVLSHVGLVWVDTNPERHQEVLRQIAAQPKPAHVPREPRPAAPLTEGPMILVETGGAERIVH
jgi:ribonuclease E